MSHHTILEQAWTLVQPADAHGEAQDSGARGEPEVAAGGPSADDSHCYNCERPVGPWWHTCALCGNGPFCDDCLLAIVHNCDRRREVRPTDAADAESQQEQRRGARDVQPTDAPGSCAAMLLRRDTDIRCRDGGCGAEVLEEQREAQIDCPRWPVSRDSSLTEDELDSSFWQYELCSAQSETELAPAQDAEVLDAAAQTEDAPTQEAQMKGAVAQTEHAPAQDAEDAAAQSETEDAPTQEAQMKDAVAQTELAPAQDAEVLDAAAQTEDAPTQEAQMKGAVAQTEHAPAQDAEDAAAQSETEDAAMRLHARVLKTKKGKLRAAWLKDVPEDELVGMLLSACASIHHTAEFKEHDGRRTILKCKKCGASNDTFESAAMHAEGKWHYYTPLPEAASKLRTAIRTERI